MRALNVMVLLLCYPFWASAARADACSPVTVGVDTSRFNTFFPIYLGSAYGQVFEARGTELRAISVWRDPCPNATPLVPYVLALDSTGTPDFQRILRTGPTLVQADGDCFHAVRYRFLFDPPVALGRSRRYEFAVQVGSDPVCDGAASLLGDTLNPYPGGAAWRHIRTYPFCYLGSARPGRLADDLVFWLEFCDTTTAARRWSWGDLKLRYR